MPTLQTSQQRANNQFIIPPDLEKKYPDLVELIKQTPAMNLEEKNYWFKIIPMMNADQITNLRSILVKERQNIEDINQKYTSDIQAINTKYQSEINALEYKEKMKFIKAQEKRNEVNENKEETELLEELANL